MKRAILALMTALAVFVGISAAPAGGTAQAHHGINHANTVNNSGYSSADILVCGFTTAGNNSCVPKRPGETAWQTTNWNPNAVAVGPYYIASYRAVKNWTTVMSPWVTVEGGNKGTWIDVAAIQWYYGGSIEVQVIMSGPFY